MMELFNNSIRVASELKSGQNSLIITAKNLSIWQIPYSLSVDDRPMQRNHSTHERSIIQDSSDRICSRSCSQSAFFLLFFAFVATLQTCSCLSTTHRHTDFDRLIGESIIGQQTKIIIIQIRRTIAFWDVYITNKQ